MRSHRDVTEKHPNSKHGLSMLSVTAVEDFYRGAHTA